MVIRPFLIVNSRGTCRVTKTQPALQWDEISIQLELDLPYQLFKKPSLSASITVPQDAVQAPVIAAEVIENIEAAIKQHSGVSVRLVVTSDEEE